MNEEKILPDDLEEVLNKKSNVQQEYNQQIAYGQQQIIKPISYESQIIKPISYEQPIIKPMTNPLKPTDIKKKKNIFIRVSENISNKPKYYLVLIIL